MKKVIIILVGFLLLQGPVHAQKWSVQTNLLDWLSLGTANLEAGMSLSQHFSLMAGARYNPWEFTTESPASVIRNQQTTGYVGLRYWTWYVNSGFWMGLKGQYMNSFSNTGIWRAALKEGKNGWGGGLSMGYTFMLHKHLNLEAGLGVWAVHFQEYGFYSSPAKTFVRQEGPAFFIYPDMISLSLVYVF